MGDAGGRAGADEEGFKALLAFLERGPASASGYERARARLVDFFRWRGVVDAEAYADRTLDRAAAKLKAGESPTTPDPLRYLLGVARFIYLEGVKAEARDRAAAQAAPVPPPAPEADPVDDLEACLEEMHPNERTLLLRYHAETGQKRIQGRKRLADELRVTLTSLRMRTFRLRQRLERCLKGRIEREMDPDSPPPRT